MKNTPFCQFSKLTNFFKSDNILILLGILSLLPFILISYFNNPSADDFCYHNSSRDLGFWNAQLSWYNGVTGRYFSTAILSINSLVSDSFLFYKLIPVLLLVLLFTSIYYLNSLLFVKLKKKVFFIQTLFILTLYLVQMPSITQGLYWLSGSITYQLSNIVAILLLCFLIKLLETNEKKYLLSSIFFTIIIIGSNETSMLLIDFLLAVIFVYYYIQNKKINYSVLIILIFAFIFSLIVIKAPGNVLRASSLTNKHQFLTSIFYSILSAFAYPITWLPIIIISSYILHDFKSTKACVLTSKLFNINPFFLCVIICCIPVIGFFPAYWSMGYGPPGRTINVIYFYFLIGLLYLILVLSFKLKKLTLPPLYINFLKWTKSKYLILSVMVFIISGNANNIRIAYLDLITGHASKYNTELKNRYKMIQNNTNDTLYVPELTSKPKTIFFSDITSNAKNWKNQCYNSYFKTGKIMTRPE